MFRTTGRTDSLGVAGRTLRQAIPPRKHFWIFYPGLLQLNLLLLGALACNITNGYDSSMLNGLQLLDTWQDYFGSPDGARLGLIVTANRIGQLGSILIISPLMTRFGRRWPILIGSLIILVGVAVQASARSVSMFIVGRVIMGFGNNIQECCCPVLISELAHPHQRPQTTAIMNTVGSIGSLLAAWVTYGTASLQPSSFSWRLPTLLQAVSSLFQIIMIFFAPESPRWLIANGREDEARRILTKYHAENEEDADIVRFEMAEMLDTLEADKTKRSTWKTWFHSAANRRRFWVILSLGFMVQWCGNAVISYFLKDLLDSIGITNSTTQLLINGGNTINSYFFATFWAIAIDHIGRRKLFLIGMAGMFCAYVIMTAATGVNESHNFSIQALSNTGVAMIFVFGIFYKMVGTTQDPYFTEISPYGLRDKGLVIKQTADGAANLFSGFVNPIGLDAIQWRYYIPWCCALLVWFGVIFLFFPETKNLTLEEVTQLFDRDEVPGISGMEQRERQLSESIASESIDATSMRKV